MGRCPQLTNQLAREGDRQRERERTEKVPLDFHSMEDRESRDGRRRVEA